MDPARRRELDEADLRWFWNSAEGDLGLSGSGDFERAAQAVSTAVQKCNACNPTCEECGSVNVYSAQPETLTCRDCSSMRIVWEGRRDVAVRMTRKELAGAKSLARIRCRACLGLGVVVPTTYPSGNAPASPSEVDPWLAIVTGERETHISARAPGWMGLTGPAAVFRRKHRTVRLALAGMETGHVVVLHAVHGPAPAQFEGGDDVPEAALILAAMNRSLPEARRDPILRKLRAGHHDRFTVGAARSHVNMLLGGSWRAYDRARGRVVDEDREPVVEVLAASERLLKRSAALLKLVADDPVARGATTADERASGVWLRPDEVARAELPGPERIAE